MEPICDHETDSSRILLPWTVIRSKSQRERIAVQHLSGRGAEVYCPMLLRPPTHSRSARRPTPLFPGYLFARSPNDLPLNGLAYCPGVHAPLRFDGRLATIHDEIIQALRMQEEGRGYILPLDRSQRVKSGASIRITSGPLKGLKGVFQEYRSGFERARVLIEFIQGQRKIEIQSLHMKVVS